MKENKKGFTLIELLVVVLIIGILAAIALPQYNKAVNKTKFAALQVIVGSLTDAYKEYVLIHGEGVKNFDDLSFILPDKFQLTLNNNRTTCMTSEEMSCCIYKYFYGSSSNYQEGYVACYNKDLSFGYHDAIFSERGEPINQKYCVAKSSDVKANNFCKNFGARTKSSTIYANVSSAIAYTFYKL